MIVQIDNAVEDIVLCVSPFKRNLSLNWWPFSVIQAGRIVLIAHSEVNIWGRSSGIMIHVEWLGDAERVSAENTLFFAANFTRQAAGQQSLTEIAWRNERIRKTLSTSLNKKIKMRA